MGRCVIIGGSDIANYEVIRKHLKKDDFNIFCDCGLRHKDELLVTPHLVVGDFDSHSAPDFSVETITLPCEKDDTDTVFAVREAISRGFTDFLFLGVVGNRLDHTLGNVSLLNMLNNLGLCGKIIDDYSEIEIVAQNTAYIKNEFAYFSLLNIYGKAEGITIKNAKYPLKNAEITTEYQYGISNECLKGETAEVTVDKGKLLLIKVYN